MLNNCCGLFSSIGGIMFECDMPSDSTGSKRWANKPVYQLPHIRLVGLVFSVAVLHLHLGQRCHGSGKFPRWFYLS